MDRAEWGRRLHKLVHVPDTWEGWAMRVLTIFLAITMVGIYVLLGKLASLEAFVAESRFQRTSYQAEEKVRQCAILSLLGSSPAEMRRLRC